MATLLYGPALSIASAAASGVPVALMLPIQSASFGRLADFVRQGVLAAAKMDASAALAITVYPIADDPDSAAAGYERALAQGNRLVIGPLTRDGVSRIVQQIRPGSPVLALNAPSTVVAMPENLYTFSLQVEAEARQIARMVFSDGRRSVLTVTDSTPLGRRIHGAFAEELVSQGGRLLGQFAYSSATADLLALREATSNPPVDAVFLALGAARARLIRPYVDAAAVQVYATSQVFDGPVERLRDVELNGVRFVDMPWLLQPDHPAVMAYSRPDNQNPTAGDSERLYAFGIDAYRIAADLVGEFRLSRESLDGVTGRIHMTRDRHFVRELTPAQFADGRPVPMAMPR